MIGRPPRSRNDRQQVQQLTEEQLKQELYKQAENKKRDMRMQQLQEKEENLKQLEYAGQDVEQFRDKIYAEYQDVLPQSSKAEQERAARIKLREEERLRRKNGLGSAYEQEREKLPHQLEKKLIENLNQINQGPVQNADWLDRQQVVGSRNNNRPQNNSNIMEKLIQPQVFVYPEQARSPIYQNESQNGSYRQQESREQSRPVPQQIQYQQPQYQPMAQQMPLNNSNNYHPNKKDEAVDFEREKKRKYKEQLDMQISQREQNQYKPPQSQQSSRPQQPQQSEVDFFSKFGQPQSQQGWRQQKQQADDAAAIQRQKYREELDKQIQEKKNREMQDAMKRPASNPTNAFDYQQQELDYQNQPPPHSPYSAQTPPNNYYGSPPPQSAPVDDSTKGRFLQRRFTSGQGEDPQRQAQKEQYAEELKRQMEEKKRKKQQEEEENKRRDEWEQQQYQQQIQLEKKRQEEQQKQKQNEIFEHQVANKQLAKRTKAEQPQDVIKKSALQILQSENIVDSQPPMQQQDNHQQYPPQYSPPYQPPQQTFQQQPQFQPQQYQPPQQYQQYHQPYQQPPPFQNQFGGVPPQDYLQQYQQVLFNEQPNHQPQTVMVHQQYLMQLQQNRQEIEMVRQILEEKLRLQQIEMQNQLLIDQYQRKVMDIQREQKLFEQEIVKLQEFIQGKQKRPLDPTVFASSVFFNALGKKDASHPHENQSKNSQLQMHNIQPLKISPFQSPNSQSQGYQQRFQSDLTSQFSQNTQQQPPPQKQPVQAIPQKKQGITESMIDNDVELPGDSEYVNFTEEQLGKSFLPELKEVKLKTQVSQNFKQSQNFKTLQSQDMSMHEFQQPQLSSITNVSCELPMHTVQKSMPPELSVVQSSQADQVQENDLQDDDNNEQQQSDQDAHSEEEYEQKDFEPEEEDVQEQQQNDDNNQASDREQYDEEIPKTQTYDLNMLKTQEYYAMFAENIKPQSRQQELKFPTKLLQQNTQKLHNDTIQQSSQCENSEIIDSQIKQDQEIQLSQAQFSVYQQSMAVPEEDEPIVPQQVSQKALKNSSRKYQKPKTLDVFSSCNNSKNEQSRFSNQPNQSKLNQIPDQSGNQNIPNQSVSHQIPDQSRCTNQNPIASQTFLYQPRVELVKSRLDNLFQHTNELMGDLPKPKREKIEAVDDDDIKSYKIEENSQWQQQLDLFAYEQSHS